MKKATIVIGTLLSSTLAFAGGATYSGTNSSQTACQVSVSSVSGTIQVVSIDDTSVQFDTGSVRFGENGDMTFPTVKDGLFSTSLNVYMIVDASRSNPTSIQIQKDGVTLHECSNLKETKQ